MAVRYSVDLCGITQIALMLLDVLSGLEHIRICTGYKVRGQSLEYFRADMDVLAEVEPVYETMPGWKQDISQVRRYDDLPQEAKQYVKRLEAIVGAPISMVSVGSERTATLIR
jgi:adenylosuccinate synthase